MNALLNAPEKNQLGGLGVALEREGGFEGCPRAVSLRLKPP